MSTLRMTEKQREVVKALSKTKELSNAQVAERARVSDGYASKVLRQLERLKPPLARSRIAQDAEDPQTTYRLWMAA